MCFFLLPGLAGLAGAAGGAGGAAAGASGLATAMSVIGTGLGVVGSIAGGVQQNNVAKYNAQVAENNAGASRAEASYEANMQREQQRRIMGAQRAAGASSGLDLSTGTPVAVLGDTAKQSEMDIMARLYSGEAAAVGFQNQAAQFRAEGKAAKQAGFINAGTSLVSGLGNIAKQRRGLMH